MPFFVLPAAALALLLVGGVLTACLRARHRPPVVIDRAAYRRAQTAWATYRDGEGAVR